MITIEKVEHWVFRAPIETPIAAAFGSMNNRPALFIRVTASDGAWGWGEVFCNFPQVGAEHRAKLVESLFIPLLEGLPFESPRQVCASLYARTRRMAIQCGEPGPFSQIIGAIDQALWDMAGRRAGKPLWRLLTPDGAPNNRVRLYASGLGPEQVAETAVLKRSEGYTAFKFKVGFGVKKDIENFTEIRAALGSEAVLMVDANQAWDPGNAAEMIHHLAPFNPTWIEEPMAADESLESWRSLAQVCGMPLAAGENLRGIETFEAHLSNTHLKFIQPDVAKWGGISGCREVALLAARHNVTFCPHWLGGGVGLAASVHLRAAMGADGFVEVDANPNPLREEVFPISPIHNGWAELPETPGTGVEPDLARLSRFRVA
jgi:D-galactarolactone cycloisomerase